MRTSKTLIVTLLAALLCSGAGTASAQSAPILQTAQAAVRAAIEQPAPPAEGHSKTPSVVTGAVIGVVTALAVTGWAAASYGENEGGKFCGPCMMQWSLLSVPVGAGLGAGIGFGVASIRHSSSPNAPRPRLRAGITFTTRF